MFILLTIYHMKLTKHIPFTCQFQYVSIGIRSTYVFTNYLTEYLNIEKYT